MDILKSDKRNGTTAWKTKDGRFTGILIDPVVMVEHQKKERIELQAAALLAVPKYEKGEPPSINKYSPVIATAETTEELGPLLSAWAAANAGKTAWDLRA